MIVMIARNLGECGRKVARDARIVAGKRALRSRGLDPFVTGAAGAMLLPSVIQSAFRE
jgi:hypothetical protein